MSVGVSTTRMEYVVEFGVRSIGYWSFEEARIYHSKEQRAKIAAGLQQHHYNKPFWWQSLPNYLDLIILPYM